MKNEHYVPFLATAVHRLANKYDFLSPKLVFHKRCYLNFKNASYAFDTLSSEQRVKFILGSTPEFKHRDIFVTQNVLTRY